MLAWCHGAPGIGLARLALHALMQDEPELLAEAEAAIRTTSATLGHATLTGPVFPVAAGTLAAGDYYGVDLQFSASNLLLGQNYLLTVRGTYTLGLQTLGFAVNR